MKNVDFYFDFVSPYAYLAHHRVLDICERYGCSVTYKPIDLKQAKLATGNTAPPTVMMPAKRRYSFMDLNRWSKRYGLPFVPPTGTSFSPDRANIGAFLAIDEGRITEYADAVWGEFWGNGTSIGEDRILEVAAAAMGWSLDHLTSFIASDAAVARYDAGNKAAHAQHVFGVPTMIVDDQFFWGNDRLDFFEEYLAG